MSPDGIAPPATLEPLRGPGRRVLLQRAAAALVVVAAALISSSPVRTADPCPAGWTCRFLDGYVHGIPLSPEAAGAAGWPVGTAFVLDVVTGRSRCAVVRPRDSDAASLTAITPARLREICLSPRPRVPPLGGTAALPSAWTAPRGRGGPGLDGSRVVREHVAGT